MINALQLQPMGRLAPAGPHAQPQWASLARTIEASTGQALHDLARVHEFSVLRCREFWRHFLSWADLQWEGSAARVCAGNTLAPADFFPDLRLNYAENLLHGRGASSSAIAVTSCRADGRRVRLTRAELRARVEQMAEVLREQGVGVGDRVVAVLRNDADAVVTALAVAAIGASLGIAPPEIGASSIIERFHGFAPRMLIAHVAARPHDTGPPVAARVAQVAAALGALNFVLTPDNTPLRPVRNLSVNHLPALLAEQRGAAFLWQRFAFNQPLFVMNACTTVHTAGALLMGHVREHRIDCDLRSDDKLFSRTSCGSMTWMSQLSALASGCEIVLYDGPMGNAGALRRIVRNEDISVFRSSSSARLKRGSLAGAVVADGSGKASATNAHAGAATVPVNRTRATYSSSA